MPLGTLQLPKSCYEAFEFGCSDLIDSKGKGTVVPPRPSRDPLVAGRVGKSRVRALLCASRIAVDFAWQSEVAARLSVSCLTGIHGN